MALVITFTPGEQFDEEGDTITLNKLNRVINSGYGVVASGSIEEGNIGDGEVSAVKLATALDLTGKTVTLPVGIDLSKGIATGAAVANLGTPLYKGQIGVLNDGKLFISKGTSDTDDWVYGGYFTVTGDVDDLAVDSREDFGTPDAVGQWAIDSAGVTYRATAVSGHNDWVPIRAAAIDFKDQVSADPPALAGHVRVYAKGSDIFVMQPDGGTEQITGFGQQVIYIRKTNSAPGQGGVTGHPYPDGATGTQGYHPQTIPGNSWEGVLFNQQAGELPYDSLPDAGAYSWYESYDSASGGIVLSAGTYDYTYANNFSLDINYSGDADPSGFSSWVRGCLLGIPMSTPHEEETHYNIPYSESMNKSNMTLNDDSGLEESWIDTPMFMDGRFTIDETTKVISRIWVAQYGGLNMAQTQWRWGAGENHWNTPPIGGSRWSYPPYFSGLNKNVMAYIKITKVQ